MKKAAWGLAVPVLSILLCGCSAYPHGGHARPMEMRPTSDPYVLGDDKGFTTNILTRDPIGDAERRIRRIPGILDAQIITFQDTVIVGALTDGRTQSADRRVHVDSPYNEKQPETRTRVNTDGYNNRIISTVRARLQSETHYNLIVIGTDQATYSRIADIKRRVLAGQPVSDDEYVRLINDISYTKAPFNLVD